MSGRSSPEIDPTPVIKIANKDSLLSQQPTQAIFNRRRVLKLLGGTFLGTWAASWGVKPAFAQDPLTPSNQSEKPQPEKPKLPSFDQQISQLSELDVSFELKHEVSTLLELFKTRSDMRFARIEKLTRLAEIQPNPAIPSLFSLYQQSLGRIDSIQSTQQALFLKDEYDLKQIRNSIQVRLEELQTASKRGGDIEHLLKIFKNSLSSYMTGRLFLLPDEYISREETEVIPHPDIELDSDGRQRFLTDQQVIKKYLQKHPNARKLAGRIVVHNPSYGVFKKPPPEGIGGLFRAATDPKIRKPLVQLDLYLSHMPQEKDIESILNHEMLGHGTDLEVNRIFADQLTEEQEVELLRLKYLTLLNPECSPILTSIPQLFDFPQEKVNENPASSNDSQTDIDDSGSADDAELKSILLKPSNFVDGIKTYPIMNALFGHVQKTNFRRSLWQEVLDESGKEKREPSSQSRAATDILINKPFTSLKEFIKEYLPILSRKTEADSPFDSKIICWALEHYPDEFSKYPFLWDLSTAQGTKYTPRQGDKGEVWINYCHLVVINAALIHALFNATPEIRKFLTDDLKTMLEYQVLERVRGARNEAYAEGIAQVDHLENLSGTGITYKDVILYINSLLSQAS